MLENQDRLNRWEDGIILWLLDHLRCLKVCAPVKSGRITVTLEESAVDWSHIATRLSNCKVRRCKNLVLGYRIWWWWLGGHGWRRRRGWLHVTLDSRGLASVISCSERDRGSHRGNVPLFDSVFVDAHLDKTSGSFHLLLWCEPILALIWYHSKAPLVCRWMNQSLFVFYLISRESMGDCLLGAHANT